jgi:Sulfotransferase family
VEITLSPSLAGLPGPYVIGATGGSGTRVLARILRHASAFLGTHLNVSDDSLFFGAYSDRWINRFVSGATPLPTDAVRTAMARDLDVTVTQHLSSLLAEGPGSRWRAWGWKEPRSIFLLPFFAAHFPALKFLHLVRDGRDMAYSPNQNQLSIHGRALLTGKELSWEQPLQSIALWARLNSGRADYGETHLGPRYLRIRFEDLCATPLLVIQRILHFLGLRGDAAEIGRLEVAPPASLGRWRSQDPAHIEALNTVGQSALARFGYLSSP